MEKEFKFSGMTAIVVIVLLIIGLGVRFVTLSDSKDPDLDKAVRIELWISYTGHELGPDINRIRETYDYDSPTYSDPYYNDTLEMQNYEE